MEPVDGTWAMAGGWGAVGGEGEGWTGLDGEGVAQGGLRMMPLEGGEWPPPGNLAETWMKNPGTSYRLEMRADSLSSNEEVSDL